MNEKDIEKIVSNFEKYCILNNTAAQNLDTKTSNRYAKKIINCYLQLKELNKVDKLSDLLNSEHENVRLWAATHLLKVNVVIALITLKELANNNGLNAFSAEMTIKQWKKGNLKLDYPNYKVKW